MIVIDQAFIANWHPRYDESEDDEAEYAAIRDRVEAELRFAGTLTRETFTRLLNWKSPRLKGIVRLERLAEYQDRIREVQQSPENEQLQLLLKLRGFGVAAASTLLHFMYPEKYPIFDVRTVDVLFEFGLLPSRSKRPRAYTPFCVVIRRIKASCPGSKLRQIDRALFAFHKIGLERRATSKSSSSASQQAGALTAPRPRGKSRAPPQLEFGF